MPIQVPSSGQDQALSTRATDSICGQLTSSETDMKRKGQLIKFISHFYIMPIAIFPQMFVDLALSALSVWKLTLAGNEGQP